MQKEAKVAAEGFVYEPAEDSFLLLEAAEYARGDVLELFAGSGLVGLAAAKRSNSVTFADINESAITLINRSLEKRGLPNCKAVRSDLFSDLGDSTFDVIYMNPPYLPGRKNGEDAADTAVIGGEKGYEMTLKAIYESKAHLRQKGEIYLIISSLYEPHNVYKALKAINFKFEVLDTKKFFFEELSMIKIYEL